MKDSVFIIDVYGTEIDRVVVQQSGSANPYEKYTLIAERACGVC